VIGLERAKTSCKEEGLKSLVCSQPPSRGDKSTVKSAKSTGQYGNRRGTRECDSQHSLCVKTVCNAAIVIPTV
jgi:hypothetical protein